ncbi:MAG TPA: hypothetical protein VFT86_02300 [Gaiellaceae bacterium]|nr:hypothetical protein [Gaiellaceae bacterium]
MTPTRRTISKVIGLSICIAALAAPAANAEPRSIADLDPQLVATIQKADRATMSPDDRPLARGIVAARTSASPDDRAFSRTPAPETPTSSTPDDRPFPRLSELPGAARPLFPTAQAPGFQWDDASLGALTTLSLMVLLALGAFAVRRQTRRVTAL